MNRTTTIFLFLSILFLLNCAPAKKSHKRNRPYEYGWVPKSYKDITKNYENYSHLLSCKSGETIASVGAGNGVIEVAISCFEDDIHWYLQEIDTTKLYQFEKVLEHFEKLKGSEFNAEFDFVVGTEKETRLPTNVFDRIIMNNVYHELSDPQAVMFDLQDKLKPEGRLVIMEPMAKKQGDKHANCKHLRLWEPDFLKEMDQFGYNLIDKKVGEKISFLIFYTFEKD